MESLWQRPITNKRYLQAPLSEKFYTLWPECKLIFGDIEAADEREDLYEHYVSSGLWFVRGNVNGEMDFHNAEFTIRDDGVPVHLLKNTTGGLEYEIEAFSEFGRRGRCFIKFTVTNKMDHSYTENIGFLLRTDRECKLVKHSPSNYRPYNPEIIEWHSITPTWTLENRVFRDGERYITYIGEKELSYLSSRGVAHTSVTLDAGKSYTMYLSYGEGEVLAFDYEAEKEKAIALWQSELSKIKNIPESLLSDQESVTMIKHLVSTLLQHFCCPKSCNYTIVRQGGLHRMIWPFEAMTPLESLMRLGDFSEYVEPVIDMYFEQCQQESGEIVPFGVHWAMCTATALTSFAKYARLRGKKYFLKYRDRAYAAFKWIKDMRVKEGSDDIVKGLFPPFRSSDDVLIFQNYGSTDSHNLEGIRQLLSTFEQFEDDATSEIRDVYEDYVATLKAIWKNISEKTGADELRVPFAAIGDDSKIEEAYGFGHTGGYIANYLDISEYDVQRIINYYTRRGFIKGGLYDKLPNKIAPGIYPYYLDDNGRCLIWYVTTHEYMWFQYFMRHGMKDKAKEIIDCCIKFAMTKEYYMIERYNERDPYFAPWMPNASANGRFLNMLLDYYS